MSEPPGTDGPRADDGADEPVGSVAEEAAKLFGALSDWARDQEPSVPLGERLTGLAGRAAGAAGAVGSLDEHLATGGAECAWCPVCRAVHVVRQTSPEVRTHLASAASSLLQAAAGLLATAVPGDGSTPGARGPGVERIDLDTDDAPRSPDGDDDAWPEEDDE